MAELQKAKRAFYEFTAIADSLEAGDVDVAKAKTLQATRWLVTSLDTPKDQLLAWHSTSQAARWGLRRLPAPRKAST